MGYDKGTIQADRVVVTTDKTQGIITVTLYGGGQRGRMTINTKDPDMRQALIDLGWAPPPFLDDLIY